VIYSVHNSRAGQKLSDGLRRFMKTARSTDTIAYILLLKTDGLDEPTVRPFRRRRDNGEVSQDRKFANQQLLQRVDAVLQKFGGRRLSPKLSLFGTLFVESSPDALKEFAAADYVNAISENTEVSGLG
jgi:hypothetical protein